MGHCVSKSTSAVKDDTTVATPASPTVISAANPPPEITPAATPHGTAGGQTPAPQSPWLSTYPAGINPSPARSTPRRLLRWPFPPPSPAKPIMTALLRRRGSKKPKDESPSEGVEEERGRDLDKYFGFSKNFGAKYELGKEVGRGHFGHTCWAKGKKGEVKGESVAVKIISKAKITSAIAVEDVRREVKILKALSGHKHMLKFYDAFEDATNVYIVMELCEGGELLDRILSRGGRYTEEDSKSIIVQILNAVAFCHLQGVVHRDLKPENFLFTTKDEDATLKLIDFGLSDFAKPDQRLNDVVGSAYYVAPEILHRSYNVEGDMWSIGVITYILLCGSRPFWARTESGIFRSVLRAEPNFNDSPWPEISKEARDFVKRLLIKDHRKRMTAVQALCHPWLRDENRPVPVDISAFRSLKWYLQSTPFKCAALKALSKAVPEDELFYFRAQFKLLEPKDGRIAHGNVENALVRNATDAMKYSRVPDVLQSMVAFALTPMTIDFDEFCAALTCIYQLEALEGWDKIATTAFAHFEQEGNKVISVEELAQEMNLTPTAYPLVKDWIRSSDRKLTYIGFTKFLHGVTIRSSNTRRQ